MKLSKALEKFEKLMSIWGLTYNIWVFTGEQSFRLLRYNINARPNHLDIYVNKTRLPWKIPDNYESTIPPKNSKEMNDYKQFIKETEFGPHFLPLPLHCLNMKQIIKNSSIYTLSNQKKIRVENLTHQIKIRGNILLDKNIVSTFDQAKIQRWLDDFTCFKKAGKEKKNQELVRICAKTIRDLKVLLRLRKKVVKEKKNEKTNEISGLVGYRKEGKIKGRVKVILDARELKKLQKDDILVTPMTTPDYVVAIEKAKAIITDRGGLLCHAVIISREFKVPCIIGTKIATKVLRDDDYVEVDANRGIVKILKRTSNQ